MVRSRGCSGVTHDATGRSTLKLRSFRSKPPRHFPDPDRVFSLGCHSTLDARAAKADKYLRAVSFLPGRALGLAMHIVTKFAYTRSSRLSLLHREPIGASEVKGEKRLDKYAQLDPTHPTITIRYVSRTKDLENAMQISIAHHRCGNQRKRVCGVVRTYF